MKFEGLVIKWVFQIFWYYLAGTYFDIITDHSLQWLYRRWRELALFHQWQSELEEFSNGI